MTCRMNFSQLVPCHMHGGSKDLLIGEDLDDMLGRKEEKQKREKRKLYK